ncbi:hypothetical protein J7T55_005821 [Diaporthe amygdali]|uniref:uncharacterized protein n=1 Tax=Phomopsis amygdali TaxID=1214568 RepID=UPI0022FE8ECE|nr:uncharacterized protein J7T55_005821 [Diaporthe amygdali]KAJ0124483.1 hypothetical protein J7T55_005821 [Diaporthe amygdali]
MKTDTPNDKCSPARRLSAARHLPALHRFSASRINLEDLETILILISIHQSLFGYGGHAPRPHHRPYLRLIVASPLFLPLACGTKKLTSCSQGRAELSRGPSRNTMARYLESMRR